MGLEVGSTVRLAGLTWQDRRQMMNDKLYVPGVISIGGGVASTDAFCESMENGPQRRPPCVWISVGVPGAEQQHADFFTSACAGHLYGGSEKGEPQVITALNRATQ